MKFSQEIISWLTKINMLFMRIPLFWLVSAVSCLCISLWGDKAAAPLHLMHAGFTVTLTAAPFITSPFLSQNTTSPNTTTLNMGPPLTSETFMLLEPAGVVSDRPLIPLTMTATNIWIPFTIVGGIALLSSLGFLVLFCLGFRYDPPKESSQSNHSYTLRSLCRCRRENIYPVYFLCSIFVLYILNRLRISTINLFLFPIASNPPLNFSYTLAAAVMTVYSASMVLGRLLIAGLSHYVHMTPLLWIQSILLLVTHILLALVALDGDIQFWVLSGLCGFWSGPAYPSIIAWANNYLEVHGYVMAIVDLGIGVGSFLSSWLSGYLFQYYGSKFVFYLVIAGSGIMLLVLLPHQIVAIRHGDRYKDKIDGNETSS